MPKTIILVRHASAEDAGPHQADFNRKLLPRGRMEAEEMSIRLRARIIKPDYILSSPAVRARQTAEIFASNTGLPPGKIIPDPALYNASSGILADTLRQGLFPEPAGTLLLIAHNPGISRLALECAPDLTIDHLPPCGMVLLEAGTGSWADLETRHCSLLSLELP